MIQHSSGARNACRTMPIPKEYFMSGGQDFLLPPDVGDTQSFGKWERYSQSKHANLLFAYSLAEYYNDKYSNKQSDGVAHAGDSTSLTDHEKQIISVCAHPGACNSDLQAHTNGNSYLDNFVNGLAVLAGAHPLDGMGPIFRAALDATAQDPFSARDPLSGSVKDGEEHGDMSRSMIHNGDFIGPVDITGPPVVLPDESKLERYQAHSREILWSKSVEATMDKEGNNAFAYFTFARGDVSS